LAPADAAAQRETAQATLLAARQARRAMGQRQREVDGTLARMQAQLRATGMYSL
jgi:hypothetical protein